MDHLGRKSVAPYRAKIDIYHCLKFKQPHDAEKALGVVSPTAEQALLDLQADLDERFEVMEAHLIAEEG